jgi:transposase InsO family protein
MSTQSIGGSSYFITFIDDHSRWCEVFFLKKKSESFEKFKIFQQKFENHFGKIKTLRTDNGGEYVSKQFSTYLEEKGIRHKTTVPDTPQQNGVAERKNRTLGESARSMIFHAGIPKVYWAEAIATECYFQIRSLTRSIEAKKAPYEILHGRKPDLSHLKVFGCVAYAHVVNRTKLDAKAQKLRFVGYATETKGYKLFDEKTRKVLVRRDVKFN